MVRVAIGLVLLFSALLATGCNTADDDLPVPLRPDGRCNEDLVDALRRGDAPRVRALVARHVQVRCSERPPSVGYAVRPSTPLELAVATGQPELVRMLIAAGAKPDHHELEAIYQAVRSRRIDLVKLLLDSGARADAPSGTPLLREAILQHDPAIAALLLERGAKANQRWFSELQPGGDAYDPATLMDCLITPLMEAAARGEMELVTLLVRAGADRNQIDCKGRSAADYARRRNHSTVAEMLSQ
jgi:hypothetical protein